MPRPTKASLERAVETMRVYVGSVDKVTVRQATRLQTRVYKALEKVCTQSGVAVDDAWAQVEAEARKRGLRLAVLGKDI